MSNESMGDGCWVLGVGEEPANTQHPTPITYTELHCHSNYSMLDGASHPEDLVARAKTLGMDSLAITDHDGLYGAVRFWQAAVQEGIRPIIGSELTLEDGSHIVLLAENRLGYSNLCRLITAAHFTTEGRGLRTEAGLGEGERERGGEGESERVRDSALRPQSSDLNPKLSTQHSALARSSVLNPKAAFLSPAALAGHTEGLICLSGCRRGEIARALLAEDRRRARRIAEGYLRLFGDDNFWIEIQHHLRTEDDWLCAELVNLADRVGAGCVATNDVHYATQDRHRLQDILVCIKNRTNLDAAAGLLRPNSEYYLKSGAEMEVAFQLYPGAVANSRLIAERCDLDLNFKGYRFPGFQPPEGETSFSHLHKLCHEGARSLYRPLTPAVSRQLAHELEVIHKTGLAEYFLIVWDIMRYARERGIPGQGRGSAADSIVAYVLGITKVDPIRHNLLFERFLSEEMTGMPDIDIDFSTNHREEIIQYVYKKYGQDYTGMVCNVVTYRARNALREVGKALGMPNELIGRIAKAVNRHSTAHLEAELDAIGIFDVEEKEGKGLEQDRQDRDGWTGLEPKGEGRRVKGEEGDCHPPTPDLWPLLLDFCLQIEGFPRHLSIHVGGMLITATPLVEIAPLERAAAPGRVVVQFNKDDVEDMGLIKMDLLGLRTLSVIHDALETIRKTRGVAPDLDRVSLDDPAVYDMLCEPDNIGVFQVESRAQSQTLPKMRPRSIEDLIVEISIIRPGPLQGNMVHPYLRRRQGLEEVVYLHPSMKPALEETLGVVLFQEQVIRVAVAVAGFTPGEADLFRRAMNRHRSGTEMEKIHTRFVEGAVRNGLDAGTAETIFKQLAGFASYGFCKSHAAAFAKTAYDTAYLKLYYAPEFYAAILNNQPMGFYSPEVVAEDAKRHGIRILPVDVNRSRAKCTVEGKRGGREQDIQDGDGWTGWDGGSEGEKGRGRDSSLITHHSSLTQSSVPSPQSSIRLGLSYVHGLGEAALERLEKEQKRGSFRSLADFLERSRLSMEAVENLISVGAMDCFGRPRREMLWEVGARRSEKGERGRGGRGREGVSEGGSEGAEDPSLIHHSSPDLGPQFPVPSPQSSDIHPTSLPLSLCPSPSPSLPSLTPYEETAAEYSIQGVAVKRHAVELFRAYLEESRAVPCARLAELPRNLVVRVAGLVVTEQAPPTAKGHVFLTLEDETGLANVILRPGVYDHFRQVLQSDQMVVVEGVINRQDGITNLMARKITSLHQEALPATRGIKRPHRR